MNPAEPRHAYRENRPTTSQANLKDPTPFPSAALRRHLERQCQRAHIGWTLNVNPQVIDPPFSTGWFLKCGPLVVSSEICLGSDRLCSGCLSDELFGGDHTRTTPHGAH